MIKTSLSGKVAEPHQRSQKENKGFSDELLNLLDMLAFQVQLSSGFVQQAGECGVPNF